MLPGCSIVLEPLLFVYVSKILCCHATNMNYPLFSLQWLNLLKVYMLHDKALGPITIEPIFMILNMRGLFVPVSLVPEGKRQACP